MKSMGIDTITNFPFPNPPDHQALCKAEKVLTYLGALSPSGSINESSRITELGNAMSLFPLSPRFSRMLVTAQQHGCLPYIICIVSALAVGDPFTPPEILENEASETEDSAAGLRAHSNKEKEAIRQRRKAFHDSQRVRPNVLLSLFLTICRSMQLSETIQVTCSNIFPLLGHMNMPVELWSSVPKILCGQRFDIRST